MKNILFWVIVAIFIFCDIFLAESNMESYKQDDDVFNVTLSSPEEFLEFLKKDIKKGVYTFPNNSYTSIFQIINQPPDENWIKPEHIHGLINVMDSKEPCRPVMSIYSSTIPRNLSTVGDEAIFLIQGFRAKRYPPRPNSQTYSSKEKEEVRKWWKKWSKENNFQK